MDGDEQKVVLAIDVGGSKYMAGLVAEDGEILCSSRHEWVSRKQDDIVAQLASAAQAELDAHPDLAGRVVAGGITIPGFADPVRGTWIESDYPVVQDLEVCNQLSERMKLPFYGDNDCNACVLAEARFGSCKGVDDFLYMTVSSGIGGGVYLGGKLYYGEHLLAGEIGLTRIDARPRPEISGTAFGRLEAYGCTRGMAQTYVELSDTGRDSASIDGRWILDAACAGDDAAQMTLCREGIVLGRAIANADALLAPSHVVIGGGISLMLDAYREPLERELHRIRPASKTVVEASSLGYEGAFLGAAACALRGLETNGVPDAVGMKAGSVLEVALKENEGAVCSLVCDGKNLLAKDGAGKLGEMLVATGVDDAGRKLSDILLEDDSSLRDTALWRCVGFARTMFDPAEIRVNLS